ncbi:MAG: hypothetical protein WCI05_12290 [Myxococcales bacterium]
MTWLHKTEQASILEMEPLARSSLVPFTTVGNAMERVLARAELVRTVEWAGDPRQPTESAPEFSPRRSLALWRQEVHQASAPWQPHVLEALSLLRPLLDAILMARG